VHVATTVAAANDVDTVAARHADLASADLLPDTHLVDAGYVSVAHVLAARADHGIELVGPLPPDAGWQARDEQGLELHPLGHPRSRPELPSARPGRGPEPAPRRAGHRRLAGVLWAPRRDRGHHRQAAHRADLHQARDRGLAKTHLQQVLTTLALNLVRVDAWRSGIPPGGTWASRLTRLRAELSPV
jgi:hypothetical protein